MILPVIMAGGSGSRLWPLSRRLYPKQFCALTSERTMLQETVLRLAGLDGLAPLIVCNEEHRFLAAEQLRLIGGGDETIILEPVGRNTAPAIALAALQATRDGDDPILLVLAADHLIGDIAGFHRRVRIAVGHAQGGALVTFGIMPDGPETGYGYIERGDPAGTDAFRIRSFAEKPDRAAAETYIASGRYLWNSGMFAFRASRYLEELGRHAPDVLEACRKAFADTRPDMQFMRIDASAFRASPNISVDYAVMERTDAALVVPLDVGWNDIGSWASLWSVLEKDADGNAFNGDVVAIGSRNTLVEAESRLVAVLGVENLTIVETPDAVLVAHKDRVQEVKQIAERLERLSRTEHLNHRKVYRPWGHYDSIAVGTRDQVKRITVNPGAKLSVQMHHHRAEHWVVVRGTARVQKGDEIILLGEDQSTYIPLGEIHSLENPGKIPLELIEVQSGSYLGEDDIIRFEDKYGRN